MRLAAVIGAVGVLLMCPCAAADGNAEAQRRLGFRYYHGDGVAQNNAKATVLFEKAAAAGDTESASNLAMMYEPCLSG
jgi:hypothetical protein